MALKSSLIDVYRMYIPSYYQLYEIKNEIYPGSFTGFIKEIREKMKEPGEGKRKKKQTG